ICETCRSNHKTKVDTELPWLKDDCNGPQKQHSPQAKVFIFTWKAHVLRSENQEEAKQTAVASLKDDSIMIVMDWAMKFVQMRHREKQSEWFAKRGLIRWIVLSMFRATGGR
ncbi:hypothetical protein QZH41_003616, partial [Actinostola sp. cb2023]